MVRCLRCSSQSIVVYNFYSQLVLPPYTVKVRGGRHSTTHGEGSSRWALVLPPNTIKIRGGRSIFLRHSQARVLPSHAVKTGRGRSTRYQAHVLPPYAVKTRGGRSAFRQAHVLPSHAIKTGRGRSTFHRLRQAHVLPPNTVKIRGGRSTRHYHEHWSSISPVWGEWHNWTTLRHLSRWNVCIPDPRHRTIRMLPNLPRPRIAPWSPLRRKNRERNIYKSELDPKHAYYISYAWLL